MLVVYNSFYKLVISQLIETKTNLLCPIKKNPSSINCFRSGKMESYILLRGYPKMATRRICFLATKKATG
jgi:hypothetical protein